MFSSMRNYTRGSSTLLLVIQVTKIRLVNILEVRGDFIKFKYMPNKKM